MSKTGPKLTSQGRMKTRYAVDPSQVDCIICHRRHPFRTADSRGIWPSQYLVLWRTRVRGDPANAPVSWHGLDELTTVLDLLQDYIAQHKTTKSLRAIPAKPLLQLVGQKRKLHDHDTEAHLPTPQSGQSSTSREQSITSGTSDSDNSRILASDDSPECYNAVFQKRQGCLVPIQRTGHDVVSIDATMMPMKHMLEESFTAGYFDAEMAIRQRYVSSLAKLPGPPLTIVNDIDHETPSLKFKFINDYVFREGTGRHAEFMTGCDKCKPNMGANRGCEYTKKCGCLEYAEPDEGAMSGEQLKQWKDQKEMGIISTEGFPKRFPYTNTGSHAGCLVNFYLNTRNPVYECNNLCACGPRCKNRNVQHGRKVKLEIFKTQNRGFGLRCPQAIKRGQFIDKYIGEVISDKEADDREAGSDKGKTSYLFALDKFVGETQDGNNPLEFADCYVVDGQYMGNATRFMNHSCEPNVQSHTVSYNKYDLLVYDLAFFAREDIPAGTELCFDYLDADDTDQMEGVEDSANQHAGKVKFRCNCGSERCRGFLWT